MTSLSTSPVKHTPVADIRRTDRYVEVVAYSGRRMYRLDPDAFHCYLDLHAPDEKLGRAVAEALAASRLLSLEEANATMNRDASKQWYDAWISEKLRLFGFRSRRELFRGMKHVEARVRPEGICLTTLRSDHRQDGWEPLDGPDAVVLLPHSATDDRVGAAVRAALDRSY